MNMAQEDYEMTGSVKSDATEVSSLTSSQSDESELNFLQRLRKRPIILICVYCGIIGYGIFNVTFDWLWVSHTVV